MIKRQSHNLESAWQQPLLCSEASFTVQVRHALQPMKPQKEEPCSIDDTQAHG